MKCLIFIYITSFLSLYASAIVQSPPRIIKQPPTDELLFQVAQTILHENDKPFVIECEADGEPSPQYRWVKNGKAFEWSVLDDRISQQLGRGTLVITHPRQEDLGQYQCFAENTFGTATSNSVFVRMAELNSFKDEPTTALEANEGEPYKLACQPPDGYPKPRVFWMIQEPNLALKSINNSRITIDPEGNLWFSNVTKEDESKDFYYVCMATSDYRNEYKTGNKFLLKVNSAGTSAGLNKHSPVKQYVSRREEVGYRGKKIELFCIVGGTPLPLTTWYKDGKQILPSDRIMFDRYGKSLIIRHVISADEGDYTCEASNGVGTAVTHLTHLSVLAVPYFKVEPEIQNVAEDDTAVFNCVAEGIPEPEIKWIYNGKPISEAPFNPRRKISKNSIIIEKLTPKDTGNYGCNATNSIGYVYKDVYVNVLALPPEITEGPESFATVDGKDIIVKCTVTGAPKPLVKWVRNDQELTGGRYKILESGDLEINNVGFMDAGVYTCYATNKFGEDHKTATLTVKEHTRITDKPEDYEVAAGSTATFRCNAIADSSLTLGIDWLSNNSTIDFEAEPRFVLASDSSLSITKTIELDSGVYTCVARTELDEARAQATLIVQDVPNSPELTGTNCRREEADVSWTSTGDNRAPILRYAVQYNTSFTPDSWETVRSNIPATDHSYIIPLSPWANYTFRVIAYNKIGPSIPSGHGEMCTTQPDIPYKNPSNVMGNGTNPHNLVISWTAMPQIEHNGPKFEYKVFFRQDAPGFNWIYRIISDWRMNRLEENNQPTYKRYQIKVIAMNAKGESRAIPETIIGYSGEDQPSHPPGNFTVLEVKSSTSASLSWTPLHPDHINGELKGYKVQTWTEYDGQAGMREITVKDPDATRVTINKFIPNSVNFVRILAYNGRYNGPPSEELSFRTPEGVPGTVLSLDAYPFGSSAFQLKWTRPLEPNGNLTGYRIYYQEINGTSVGPLLERNPHVMNPDATSAKLPALRNDTKYRIHIRATTKAGVGDDFYIEESTRSSRQPDKPQFTWEPIKAENSYAHIKITWLPNYSGYPGSHFFAKYKLKGSTIYTKTKSEFLSDELVIRGLLKGETYDVSIVAVDGDFMMESDSQEVETSSEGPIIQPKENVATAGWFIGMMLAIAFLLLVLILVCIVKRNRGGKYAVHERELAAGRGDYPDEGGFHEYSQPLDTKSAGGRTSLASSSHHDGKHPESDTDSMAEYGEGDTEGMNEDGSFIGQYGRQRKPEPNSQAFATLV